MTKQLTVGIIGTSLSGLCSGIALQSLGHKVHMFEKVGVDRKGAGICLTPPAMKYLETFNIFNKTNPSSKHLLSSYQTSNIDENNMLHPILHKDVERIHTTWDNLYYSLLNKIENKSQIHFSKSLSNISVNHNITNKPLMKVEFTDNTSFDCDLVIGADGVSSKTRTFITANNHPECNLKYSGYFTWRGIVSSNQILATHPLYKFRDYNQMVLYHGKNTQFLEYIVPDYYSTSADHENVLYNWVWYVKYTENELIENNILLDKFGKQHEISMPRTLIRDDVMEQYLINDAKNRLPWLLYELVCLTKEPLIQVIMDYQCKSMMGYFEDIGSEREGGILLVGDAPYVLRPHLIRATSKGMGDALCLYEYLLKYNNDETSTLKQVLCGYNEERSSVGIDASNQSIELGKKVVLQTQKRDECAWCYIKPAV